MTEIHLGIDVGTVGNLFAIAVVADHFSFQVIRRDQVLGVRTGYGDFISGRNTTETGSGIGIEAMRDPAGEYIFTAFAPRSHTPPAVVVDVKGFTID